MFEVLNGLIIKVAKISQLKKLNLLHEVFTRRRIVKSNPVYQGDRLLAVYYVIFFSLTQYLGDIKSIYKLSFSKTY